MSETYKNYTLNTTGDLSWGTPENAIIKKILDLLPANHLTLVGGEHKHSTLVAAGGPDGGATVIATTPAGIDILNITTNTVIVTAVSGTTPKIQLTDVSGTAAVSKSGPTISLSPSAGSGNTVNCNPNGVVIASNFLFMNSPGTQLNIDGGGAFPCIMTQVAGVTTFTNGSTSFKIDGDIGLVSTVNCGFDVGAYIVYAAGFRLGSSGPIIICGTGDPSVMLPFPQGSLYIKTDATTTTSRLWIKTNGGTWTYFTSAA